MSMHKIPLTQLEEDGLRAHGLDIGSPSQLSDVFRHGIKWALEQTAPQPERGGLVAALEQFADDSNCCYDTCNISRDVAKDALASYRSTQGGDA